MRRRRSRSLPAVRGGLDFIERLSSTNRRRLSHGAGTGTGGAGGKRRRRDDIARVAAGGGMGDASSSSSRASISRAPSTRDARRDGNGWTLPPRRGYASRLDVWTTFAISSLSSSICMGRTRTAYYGSSIYHFSSYDKLALSTCCISTIFGIVISVGMRYRPCRDMLTRTSASFGGARNMRDDASRDSSYRGGGGGGGGGGILGRIFVGWTLEMLSLLLLSALWTLSMPIIVNGDVRYDHANGTTSEEDESDRGGGRLGVPLAMVGTEIWNANLFYSTWISTISCLYLLVELLTLPIRDRGITIRTTHSYRASNNNNNAYSKRWTLLLLASFVIFGSSLSTYTGETCTGELMRGTSYCARALSGILMGGLFQILLCATVCVLYRLSHMSKRGGGDDRGIVGGGTRGGGWDKVDVVDERPILSVRLRDVGCTISAFVSLVVQGFNVALLTGNDGGGPGNVSGTLYFGSWLGFGLSFELCLRYLEYHGTATTTAAPPYAGTSAIAIARGGGGSGGGEEGDYFEDATVYEDEEEDYSDDRYASRDGDGDDDADGNMSDLEVCLDAFDYEDEADARTRETFVFPTVSRGGVRTNEAIRGDDRGGKRRTDRNKRGDSPTRGDAYVKRRDDPSVDVPPDYERDPEPMDRQAYISKSSVGNIMTRITTSTPSPPVGVDAPSGAARHEPRLALKDHDVLPGDRKRNSRRTSPVRHEDDDRKIVVEDLTHSYGFLMREHEAIKGTHHTSAMENDPKGMKWQPPNNVSSKPSNVSFPTPRCPSNLSPLLEGDSPETGESSLPLISGDPVTSTSTGGVNPRIVQATRVQQQPQTYPNPTLSSNKSSSMSKHAEQKSTSLGTTTSFVSNQSRSQSLRPKQGGPDTHSLRKNSLGSRKTASISSNRERGSSAALTEEGSRQSPPRTVDGDSPHTEYSSNKSKSRKKEAVGIDRRGGPPPPPYRRTPTPDTYGAPMLSIHTGHGDENSVVSDPTLDAGLADTMSEQSQMASTLTSKCTSYEKKSSDETVVRSPSNEDSIRLEVGGNKKDVDSIVAAALAYAEKSQSVLGSQKRTRGGSSASPSSQRMSSHDETAHSAMGQSLRSYYSDDESHGKRGDNNPPFLTSAPVDDLVANALWHAQEKLQEQQRQGSLYSKSISKSMSLSIASMYSEGSVLDNRTTTEEFTTGGQYDC